MFILRKIALATFLFFPLAFYASQFDSMIVFGDSLSDNGNLYRHLEHFIPKSPPYHEGHFSNGPVWVESLFDHYFPQNNFQNFHDFAVGGAGAVLAKKEVLPYTLTMEVDDYLYLHHYNNKDNSLFIIWIGANNYINGPTNVEQITTEVVDAIGSNIEKLISHGANMFVLANLPNMGLTPEANKNNKQALTTQLSELHNQKLLAKYNELMAQHPNVKFAYFDVHSFFDEVIADPAKFSMTNTQDPCYDGKYYSKKHVHNPSKQRLAHYLTQQARIQNIYISEETKQAILTNPSLREALAVGYQSEGEPLHSIEEETEACQGYMFWDHVHPTSLSHQYIALYAQKVIDAAGFKAKS